MKKALSAIASNPRAAVVGAALAIVAVLGGAPASAQTTSPIAIDYAEGVANFQREMHNSVLSNVPLLAVTVGLVAGVTYFYTTIKKAARG